ncbi:MAG: secondary thiamine-phosphate synthase enzyme YjbQ [Candidatus Longimicrobiales bacterium M2_2A_002]
MSRIRIETREREQLVDFTADVQSAVDQSGVKDGVIHLWSLHTTCAITVNEGADPDVRRDIVVNLRRVHPRDGDYRHAEGNSDAHIKTALIGPGETLLIEDGTLVLGTWQKVFLCEWDGPRRREVAYRVVASGTGEI